MTSLAFMAQLSILILSLISLASANAQQQSTHIDKISVPNNSILIVQKRMREAPKKNRAIANYAVVIDLIQDEKITYRIFDTGANIAADTVQKQKTVTDTVAEFEKKYVVARAPGAPGRTADRTKVPKIGDLYRFKTQDSCRLYRLQATFPHGQGQSYLIYGDDNILRLVESMPSGAYQDVPNDKASLASCTAEKKVPEMLMKGGVLTAEPAPPVRVLPAAPAGKPISVKN